MAPCSTLIATGLETRSTRTRRAWPRYWGKSGSTTPRTPKPPLRLFGDPIEWLRNGCRGAVVVDWRAVRYVLADRPGHRLRGRIAGEASRERAEAAGSYPATLRAGGSPCSSLKPRRISKCTKATARPALAWSSPVPLVGQIERVAYPLDALPPAIRGAVEEVQDAVQAPPEMVASSALAVASLAAQSLADVSRSRTLPGPCSLYFLTVAESGDRKSTVDRLMGRAVHAFQDEQRDAARLTLAGARCGPCMHGKPSATRQPTG